MLPRRTVIRRKMNVYICECVFVSNRVYKYYGVVCVLYACCSHHLQLPRCRALPHCTVLNCTVLCRVYDVPISLTLFVCAIVLLFCLWHKMQIKSVIWIAFDVGSFTISGMLYAKLEYLLIIYRWTFWILCGCVRARVFCAYMRKKFIRTLRAIHLHTFPSSITVRYINWFNILCCRI